MVRTIIFAITVTLLCSFSHNVIPQPNRMEMHSGRHNPEKGATRVYMDDSIPAEGYLLTITRDSVIIGAGTEAGVFYAWQTVEQLRDPKTGMLPCVEIEDAPRFPWRGFMLDVSRHFFDMDFVKKQIDAISAIKLNTLHLHLTDAAGWRIEIDRYPLLTEMAAWRSGDTWQEWADGGARYLREGDSEAYGGYFTKEELREIVQYAAERYVTVVPEFEMPSHSEEVLAAYPELGCTGEPYRHSDFCIGKEETFEFIENVLTEIMEIFPSQYIHIGGDEASKQAWKECPACRKRMVEEGLKDVDELQSYMIRRVGRFLHGHGRTLVGWDEIMQGGADSTAVVMAWRGEDQGAKSALQGHPTVMTPGAYCYFDTYQDAPYRLPAAMGGYHPLSKVYSFEPVPEEIAEGAAVNILGLQGNMFAEFIPTESHAETMIYPRLFAIAEVGWTQPALKDYEDFHRRALLHVEQMREDGYSPFDLANEYGNRPEARGILKHLGYGCPVKYDCTYYPTYTAGGDTALTDGVRGSWTYSDKRWQGFISRKHLDVTIDLGKVRKIKSVTADFMQICGPGVFHPAEIIVSVSDDGENFTELSHVTRDIVRDNVLSFVNEGWHGRAKARYVRFQAIRSKHGGFIFTDEIVIR